MEQSPTSCYRVSDGIDDLIVKKKMSSKTERLKIRNSNTIANLVVSGFVSIAQSINKPILAELRSYVKRKDRLIWIVCALERETKRVVSLHVGNRTNQTLSVVLNTVTLSNPVAIYTDRLKQYRYLIDEKIHKTKRFGTNHIERKHLSLRTHIKRLNRKTIRFSRSSLILISVLKIYFWL